MALRFNNGLATCLCAPRNAVKQTPSGGLKTPESLFLKTIGQSLDHQRTAEPVGWFRATQGLPSRVEFLGVEQGKSVQHSCQTLWISFRDRVFHVGRLLSGYHTHCSIRAEQPVLAGDFLRQRGPQKGR